MQHLNAQLPADKRSTFDSWDSLSSSIRAVPARQVITPPPGMPPLARVSHQMQHGHSSDARTRRNQRVVRNDLYTVSSTMIYGIDRVQIQLHALCCLLAMAIHCSIRLACHHGLAVFWDPDSLYFDVTLLGVIAWPVDITAWSCTGGTPELSGRPSKHACL